MKTYRHVATSRKVVPYPPGDSFSSEESKSSDSSASRLSRDHSRGHDDDRSLSQQSPNRSPRLVGGLLSRDEPFAPEKQACPRALLESFLALSDQVPESVFFLTPLSVLLINNFSLIFTPAFGIIPESESAEKLVALAEHIDALNAFMDGISVPDLPHWKDIDVAIQFRLGILRYNEQNFTAAETCFSKLEPRYPLQSYAETRMATFYKGMTQLKQHKQTEGLATLCAYFESQYQIKNGKPLLTAPVFPANIAPAQQIDYARTLVALWAEPPSLSLVDRFRCGGAARCQARAWAKLIAIGEHALALAKAHDQPIPESDGFWQRMETAYTGLKRYEDLLSCLDHLPCTRELILKKFTIALQIPKSPESHPYIADGIIAQGPNETTTPLAKGHRATLFSQCEKHVDDKEHPLHDEAILGFGLWFGLSHHSGREIQSGFILSCGDVVDNSEYTPQTSWRSLCRPKAPCPCCQENVSVVRTYSPELKRNCVLNIKAYWKQNTKLDVVAKSLLIMETKKTLQAEYERKDSGYDPQSLLAAFITTLEHAHTNPDIQALTWIQNRCVINEAKVPSLYEIVRQHCRDRLFPDSVPTVVLLGQLDDETLLFFWNTILGIEEKESLNRAAMLSGDAQQIERLERLFKSDFKPTKMGNALIHDAFKKFGLIDDSQWLKIIVQLWDRGHCPDQKNVEEQYPLDVVLEHSRATLIALILSNIEASKAYAFLSKMGQVHPEIFAQQRPIGVDPRPQRALVQVLLTPRRIQDARQHNAEINRVHAPFTDLLTQALEKSPLLALLQIHARAFATEPILTTLQETIHRRVLAEITTPNLGIALSQTSQPYMTTPQWVSVLESDLFPIPIPPVRNPLLLRLERCHAGDLEAWRTNAIVNQQWTAVSKLMAMGGWCQPHSLAALDQISTLSTEGRVSLKPLITSLLIYLDLGSESPLTVKDLHMIKSLTEEHAELSTHFHSLLNFQYKNSIRPLIYNGEFGLAWERMSLAKGRPLVNMCTDAWPSLIGANLDIREFSPEHKQLIEKTIRLAPGPLPREAWNALPDLISEQATKILKTAIAARFERIRHDELPEIPRQFIDLTQWHAYLVSDAEISEEIAAEIRDTPGMVQPLIQLTLQNTAKQIQGLARLERCFSEQTDSLITEILTAAIQLDTTEIWVTVLCRYANVFTPAHTTTLGPITENAGLWTAMGQASIDGKIEQSPYAKLLASLHKWHALRELTEQNGDLCLASEIGKHIVQHPEPTDKSWTDLFDFLESDPRFRTTGLFALYIATNSETRSERGQRICTPAKLESLPEEILRAYVDISDCPAGTNWATEMVGSGNLELVRSLLNEDPTQLYQFTATGQTPLHRCCTCVEQLRTDDPKLAEKLSAFSDIFDHLRGRIHQRNADQTIHFNLSPQAVALIVSISNTLTQILESPNLAPRSREQLHTWSAMLQRLQLIETYQFTNDLPPNIIAPDVLATLIGDSFLSTGATTLSHDPVKSIAVFREFLAFLGKQLGTETNPLKDFAIPMRPLEKASTMLAIYTRTFSTLKDLKQSHLYRCLEKVRPETLALHIRPPLNPELAVCISGYQSRSMTDILAHPYFATREARDFQALAIALGSTENSLFERSFFQTLLRNDPDYLAAEMDFIQTQWKRLSTENNAAIVIPSGYWAADSQQRAPHHSVSLLLRCGERLQILHLNSGAGVDYHSGTRTRTATVAEQEDLFGDSQTAVIIAEKQKRLPFISKTASFVADAPMPSWFVFMCQTQLINRNSGGSYFQANHFYEVVWPTVAGTPDIPDAQKMDAFSKTISRSATSAFGLVKNMMFHQIMSDIENPIAVYTDSAADLLSRHKTHKRLMSVFYLWLGAKIQAQLSGITATPENYTPAILALELSNKITSNCMKQLHKEPAGKHLSFLIAQAQKIGTALATEANRILQHRHVGVHFDLNPTFGSRFDFPVFPLLPAGRSVGERRLPAIAGPLPEPEESGWTGLLAYTQALQEWRKHPCLESAHVRIPNTIAAIETWTLTVWNRFSDVVQSPISDPAQLIAMAKELHALTEAYYKVIDQQKYLLKNTKQDPFYDAKTALTHFTLARMAILCLRRHPDLGPVFENHYFSMDSIADYGQSHDEIFSNLVIPHQEWQAIASACKQFLDTEKSNKTPLFGNNLQTSILQAVVTENAREEIPFVAIVDTMLAGSEHLRQTLHRHDDRIQHNQRLRHAYIVKEPPLPILKDVMRCIQYALIRNGGEPSLLPLETQSLNTSIRLSEKEEGIVVFVPAQYWSTTNQITPNSHRELTSESFQAVFRGTGKGENSILTTSENTPESMGFADFQHLRILPSNILQQRMERVKTCLQTGELNLEDTEHRHLISQLLWEFGKLELSPIVDLCQNQPQLFMGLAKVLIAKFNQRLQLRGMMAADSVAFVAETLSALRTFSRPEDQAFLSLELTRIRQWLLDTALGEEATAHHRAAAILAQLISGFHLQYHLNDRNELALLLSAMSAYTKARNLGDVVAYTGLSAEPLESPKSRRMFNTITQTMSQLTTSVATMLNENADILSELATARGLDLPENPIWTHDETSSLWTCGPHAIDPISGNMYTDGYPIGSLPADILAHADYAQYFGKARFEVQRSTEINTYYSLNLDQRYRFRHDLSTSDPVVLNGTMAIYKDKSYTQISNWETHEKAIGIALAMIKQIAHKSKHLFKIYAHEGRYLFVDKPYLFSVEIKRGQLNQIMQIMYDAALSVEVPVYASNAYLYKGRLDKDTRMNTQHGYATFQRTADYVPGKPISIEKSDPADGSWRRAISKWMVETQLPGYLQDIGGQIHAWASPTEIAISTPESHGVYTLKLQEDGRYTAHQDATTFGNYPITLQTHVRLSYFENPNYICVESSEEVATQETLTADTMRFPRLGLSFAYRPEAVESADDIAAEDTDVAIEHRWLSNDTHGYKLATVQDLLLWKGFKSYLVLVPKDLAANTAEDLYKKTPFKVMIPNITLNQHNSSEKLRHSIVMFDHRTVKSPGYIVATYDPLTHRFRTESVLGKLMLAFVFFATASLEKSPYTGLNGYEMAAEILKECTQNKPFSFMENDIIISIFQVGDQHRNAHAIRLLAVALSRGSTALPSFFPGSDGLDFGDIQSDYKSYLSKEQRIDETCKLSVAQLQTIQMEIQATTKNATRIDAIFGSIATTEFLQDISRQDISRVIQLGSLNFETQPRMWAWDAQKHAISDLFLSLLSQIVQPDAKREDIRYALRFLALSDKIKPTETLLIKILYLLNQNPAVATQMILSPEIPQSGVMLLTDSLLTEFRLLSCVPYYTAIDRSAIRSKANGWLRLIGTPWTSPFGDGIAPIANFADAISTMSEAPEFYELDASQKQRIVTALIAWVAPLRKNRVAADLMTQLATTCDQIKSTQHDNVLATSKTGRNSQVQEANVDIIAGIDATRIRPLDRQPIELEFTAVLTDILGLMTTEHVESDTPKTLATELQSVKSKLANDHPKHRVRQTKTKRHNAGFPLEAIAAKHQDAGVIYKRLSTSWDAYHGLPQREFSLVTLEEIPRIQQVENVKTNLEQQSQQWKTAAQKLEIWITRVANHVRDDPEGWKFIVAQMQGRAMLTAKDNLKLLNDPNTLDSRNPFLKNIKTLLLDAVLLFAEIETHVQHLQRCISAAKSVIQNVPKSEQTGDDLKLNIAYTQFCQTLSTERTYVPKAHPEYLLFELENSLLVRDKQLAMTELMLTANKVLGQMNMGEGKSSVVMLLILIGLAKQGKLTRVIVPESLMSDMERLIKTRIGSPFETLVYVFPFHRNLIERISMAEMRTLYHQVKHCKENQHVILMTPDHALSLRLSIEEAIIQRNALEAPSPRLDTLIRVLRRVSALMDIDIIDEGDAVLSLITEINYTLGTRVPIEGSPIRQQIAIQFFHTLLFDPEIHALLSDSPGFIRRNIGLSSQLILQQDAAYTPALRRALAEKIIHRAFARKSPADKSSYVDFVVSQTATMDDFSRTLNDGDKAHLRTLRCWCRPDILGYVLGQRYRVEYGLFDGQESDYTNKAIDRFSAVPYRGKDTPIPTSTFEHPDVRIGFTVLSYFYRGLRETDMHLTLKHLNASYNTRATIFEHWIQTTQIPPTIQTWNSLHLDNPAHIAALTQALSHHPDVIAYYLTHIAFADTSNFPQKIGADGSALVHGHANTVVNAFSGTSTAAIPIGMDTEFWRRIPEDQLDAFLATDAQTLVHFANPEVITLRHTPLPAETAALMNTLVTRLQEPGSRVMSLLDPGALITGLSNQEVAVQLIQKTDSPEVSHFVRARMLGVVYFDDNTDEVMVAKRTPSGPVCQPLSVCDFKKKHLFTYFNDIKTRGIDRKLPILSQGIMTIGKDMTTDQLVQAAMRLRQLGQGQRLELWIAPDVLGQIRHFADTYMGPATEISPLTVYAWTIGNTLKKESDALRSQAPKHARALRKAPALTAQNVLSETLLEASGLSLAYYDLGSASPMPLNGQVQLQMNQRAETQVKVQTETREHVRPNQRTRTPRTEHVWNYAAILAPTFFNVGRSGFDRNPTPTLKSKSLGELFFGEQFQTESHMLNQVHVSQNFWEVATLAEPIPDLLRPMDAYLEIKAPNGAFHAVLVSGKEASEIKAILQSPEGNAASTHVLLRQLYDPVGETCLQTGGSAVDYRVLSEDQQAVLVMMMLANGDSGFLHSDIGDALGTNERETADRSREIMQELMRLLSPPRKIAFARGIQMIQNLRGKSSRFEGSPLAEVLRLAGVPMG